MKPQQWYALYFLMQQALCWALTVLTFVTISNPPCCLNCIPTNRALFTDSAGSSAQDCWRNAWRSLLDFFWIFELKLAYQVGSLQASSIIQGTHDQLHSPHHGPHCALPASLCPLHATMHHNSCSTWLIYKFKPSTQRRCKFGRAPTRYYSNSTASFNIPLTVSGDIESNPGPVKDPCGSCSRPAKCNQRSLLCEACNKFWHQKCIPAMTIIQYTELISSTIDWFCSHCSFTLPFSSCSDTSFKRSSILLKTSIPLRHLTRPLAEYNPWALFHHPST